MRALFVTSEVFPLAKTGGLADVSAALPAALRDLGIDARVLAPCYRHALEKVQSPREIMRLGDPLGCGETRILSAFLPHSAVPIFLVDCPKLYERAGGLYQDGEGKNWPDNALRFGLLSHVAAGIGNESGGSWRPDLVHANDWQAGLAPLLLAPASAPVLAPASAPASVFTIHNLAYQGIFAAEDFDRLSLPTEAFAALEFYGRISFLKAGVSSADAITTVSPTYAKEILTPEYGFGLDEVLRERASRLTGILNGVDYSMWDPGADHHLACNYSVGSIESKAACKRALQNEFGLHENAQAPLMAFVGRLAYQKTPELMLEALPGLIESGAQFALVGAGDRAYEDDFRRLAARYPGRVSVCIGQHEPEAHRLFAGADMLLHPSRYEPCGLAPMYAMRYGTIPIARKTGGLIDVIVDASNNAIGQGAATGFLFDDLSAAGLTTCIERALSLYRQPVMWRKLQMNAMRQDFSWRRSAETYADLYRSLVDPRVVATEAKSKNSQDRPRELRRSGGRLASGAFDPATKGV